MSWTPLLLLALALGWAVVVLWGRRRELTEMAGRSEELERAKERGSHAARLQYPEVDLAKCIGCGACVRACPEEGVLELIHGQAIVVHGARCVGHGRCAEECPTGGVVVRIGDLEERRDIPALDERFESPQTPGLYLAGEVTGFALVKTAIEHGTSVAQSVAAARPSAALQVREADALLDLLIVGSGPAGIACALEAKTQGLDFLLVEQDRLGGTVAHYPRQKMVLTQPVVLPRYGALKQTEYQKEELIALWEELAVSEELPLRTGWTFEDMERAADGVFDVRFAGGERLRAGAVCLALGRRGTPRKLGVPGEARTKVSYGLIDAQGFQDQHLLVVGGGDSAVEAAIALAEQPGNRVTLSYRKHAFFRIKPRNEARLAESVAARQLTVRFESEVVTIEDDAVELREPGATTRLANDHLFVMAGGVPPFEALERAGVSFDPRDRPALVADDDASGLLFALTGALLGTLAALAWVWVFRDYYGLSPLERIEHPRDRWLRPSGPVGLGLGIAATVLMLVNLAYLLRKASWFPLRAFALRAWMTAHVVTGLVAFVCVILHAALQPGNTPGGRALVALTVVVVTGAIGRYFYAFIPRAANGRDMRLDEVRTKLTALAAELDREHRGMGERIGRELEALLRETHWQRSLPRRIVALFRSRARAKASRRSLLADAAQTGLPLEQVQVLDTLMRSAQRTALSAAHFEDLRGLLASWRYLHRWIALLMVLLVGLHIAVALRFGSLLTS